MNIKTRLGHLRDKVSLLWGSLEQETRWKVVSAVLFVSIFAIILALLT